MEDDKFTGLDIPVNALARPFQMILNEVKECQVESIRLKNPVLATALSRKQLLALATTDGTISENWPDFVLTANPHGAVALAIKEASCGETKIVQVSRSNILNLPHDRLKKFDVVLHEGFENRDYEGPNVHHTFGPLFDRKPLCQGEFFAAKGVFGKLGYKFNGDQIVL